MTALRTVQITRRVDPHLSVDRYDPEGELMLLHFGPQARASLVLAAGAPTAVNTMLLALEFDTEPEFAANAVVVTTSLCGLTITALLFLIRDWLPPPP